MERFDGVLDLPRGPMRVRVRGEGPPLLWSHGVFFPLDVDDHSTLGRVLDDLPGFTVVRWDARGYGRTPPAEAWGDHRWDRMGDEVLAVADALGFDRFLAGGISMGAAITLHAALAAPARFVAQLLFALPTGWETRPAEQVRYRELLGFGTSHALAAHVREDLERLFPGGPLPAPLAAMVDELARASWTALERVIVGAAESDLPDRDAFAAFRTPTLVRAWPDDVGHPFSSVEALAAAVPHARCAVIDGFDDEAGIRAAFAELSLRW